MSKAVSFSRHGLYKKCPASYEWQYLLGNRDESGPGPAAQRGLDVHQSIEDAYNKKDWLLLHPEIPDQVRRWLLEHEHCPDIRPEMEFALTAEWEPTTFDAEDAYIRGYIDNAFIYPDRVHVHEYKTGKEYEEHEYQKKLYAMVCLILFDHIDELVVEGIYIDGKKRKPTTYSRSALFAMKMYWKKEIDKMFIPIYPARPGIHCRWCPKSGKGGGPCQLG